ncbi:fungal-specific transcription factor domain-containing protein [Fusarium redolens]|uniref:Fungal-specific transcription factor domain-containing protein n=1 Tax=Fusarium redolens TaxID=48865 RepID=A0A9P9K715_FUSRE|nr:fungal-specific transcription factor domain-containing protein [Fusarium redolens]KAH7250243.1 fungal-specific transcription factor domain-containing protein [Fusarium redolens]
MSFHESYQTVGPSGPTFPPTQNPDTDPETPGQGRTFLILPTTLLFESLHAPKTSHLVAMDLASAAGDHPNNLISSLDSPLPVPNTSSASGLPQQSVNPSQPASHANSPDRKPKKSSLTCVTCRARKVRCNGARDICSNCERLGFPCSYDDGDAGALSGALPRRRVRQACISCHSRKARCSGHMPSCDRCRSQGIECVYRPSKRARITMRGEGRSPQSQEGDREDGHNDSDPGLTDPASTATPQGFAPDVPFPDESFDALIGRTFNKFFNHVHHIPMFSFLHRASLEGRYNTGKVEKALLLALIGITSYLTDMGPGMKEYGERCIDDAEALIFADYTRPSTIKVQALVLIIKHRILSKRSPSAFMLLSIASRYAAALRLNHEAPNLCFLAQESRRRLMWALYCIDSGVSGGYRDYSLWSADKIHVGLPCNERNFEFDLPQPTERLIHDPDKPRNPQAEDVGSLALHIRIQHMRRRIMEFSRRVMLSRNTKPDELQAGIWGLQKDLSDFATHLPASFQFSESSLRLRAYSPRICTFIMIHVWWHQCQIDLYRLALGGLREALPRVILASLDDAFVDHCQRQCVEHAMSMANIFSSMHKLNSKPVTDLDMAICAYQCARVLTYAYHTNALKYDLNLEAVMERAKICLSTIKSCCAGKTAEGIQADLERLITHGIAIRGPSATPDQHGRLPLDNGYSQQALRHGFPDDHGMNDPNQFSSMNSVSISAMTDSTFPPSLVADPWVPESQVSPDLPHPSTEAQAPAKPTVSVPEIVPRQDFGISEINNAYDGGTDGLGTDSGLEYGMGLDQNLWMPNNDWLSIDALNGGVGA